MKENHRNGKNVTKQHIKLFKLMPMRNSNKKKKLKVTIMIKEKKHS